MPRDYNAADWYWRVTGRTDVYHSARFAYFALSDASYVAFLADGNSSTSIDTEPNLRDVLNAVNVRFLAEALPAIEELRPRIVRARCRLQIASFAVASATGTAVPWDTELVDPLNMHGAVNPDRIVIPETDWYYAFGGARFPSNATGYRAAQLRIGAATIVAETCVPAASGRDTVFPVGDYFQANAGDILRMFVEHSAGVSLNVGARLTLGRVG